MLGKLPGTIGRIDRSVKQSREQSPELSATAWGSTSDNLWALVTPLIPAAPSHAKGGRTRVPDRQIFSAIVYLLRTGIQWNALPRGLGASSTVHDRFQEWEQAGLFRSLWEAGLTSYDEFQGIAWDWQALDGVMTKAPFGGAATSPNPTDRGKRGVTRSLLTDGVGIPLAVAVDGAIRRDRKLVVATLDGVVIARPTPTEVSQDLCPEAGYDYDAVRTEVLERGYAAHIINRSEERAERLTHHDAKARRWVIERTHGWPNRSRRLLVRWEKKLENYLAFVHLACAQLIFNKILVPG